MRKLAILLALSFTPAQAAEPPPARATSPSSCFEVITSIPGLEGLMVNKCLGTTWVLVKTAPNATGAFVYRWYPVAVAEQEASIVNQASKEEAERLKDVARKDFQFQSPPRNSEAAAERLRVFQQRVNDETKRLEVALKRPPTNIELDNCMAGNALCPAPGK